MNGFSDKEPILNIMISFCIIHQTIEIFFNGLEITVHTIIYFDFSEKTLLLILAFQWPHDLES